MRTRTKQLSSVQDDQQLFHQIIVYQAQSIDSMRVLRCSTFNNPSIPKGTGYSYNCCTINLYNCPGPISSLKS